MIGAFAFAAQAGQTSATISITVNLVTATPVSVVSGPSTVVVCGTAAQTGATGCGVINVPNPPTGGGNVPNLPPGGAGGTIVPVVPTVVPPVVVATPPENAAVAPVSDSLPIARATLELVTLLQTQAERVPPTALRDLFLLNDNPLRLEGWRSRSVRVFSSSAAERLSNILGTSAEMRIVREEALDYTEMLVSW